MSATSAQSTPPIVSVAVPSPLRQLFDYSLSDAEPSQLLPGCRVQVEFGRRQCVGLIVAVVEQSPLAADKIKPVQRLLDSAPLLDRSLLALLDWAWRYYHSTPGEVYLGALPPHLRDGAALVDNRVAGWQLTATGLGLTASSLKRAPKQRLAIEHLNAGPQPHAELRAVAGDSAVKALRERALIEPVALAAAPASGGALLAEPELSLNGAQRTALEAVELGRYSCSLLHGVTGSGKTEVYLQLIRRVLERGQQVLVLIPEISLTAQTEQRFRSRFNVDIVTLNSSVAAVEKCRRWQRAAAAEASIVLGTRSAVFAPLPKLGLIVVDEEHDSSFKQHEGFRYHARDVAAVRAQRDNLPLLLGSATPALESLRNAQQSRYRYLALPERAGDAQPPHWQWVDLRNSTIQAGLATTTLAIIEQTLRAGQQVLVFLNRRGYAPTLLCHQCGWVASCPHCDSRLTVHRRQRKLSCHHCDLRRPLTARCDGCGSDALMTVGEGTQQTEEFLQQQFPTVPVVRVDRDSTRRQGSFEKLYALVDSSAAALLIGTQMLAKGHHFPKVTLAVIVDADSGLFAADFRAHERFAQLLLQVAGRSGRGDRGGRVLVQSHQPEHPLLSAVAAGDYAAIGRSLLEQRQLSDLPPFRHMAVVRAESSRADHAEGFLAELRRALQPHCSPQLALLGPLPANQEKRADRFRYILQITAASRRQRHQLLTAVEALAQQLATAKQCRWTIDVDPLEL